MPTDVAKLKIDAEFSALLAPLSEAESTSLRESIILEGCLMPLIAWRGILIDGHNRYKICRELHKPFNVIEIALPNREAAFNWIIDHQLSRRNITPEQASYLRGKRYNLAKQDQGGDRKSSGQNVHLIGPKTAEAVAQQCGVNEKTIRRDAKFAEAVDKLPEPLKAEVLSGKSEATKAEVIAVGEIGNAREREKAAKAVVAGEGLPKPKAAKNEPSPAAVEVVKDKSGHVVKDAKLVAVFTSGLHASWIKGLKSIKREIFAAIEMPECYWTHELKQDIEKWFKNLIGDLDRSQPHTLTPSSLEAGADYEWSTKAIKAGFVTESQIESWKKANGK